MHPFVRSGLMAVGVVVAVGMIALGFAAGGHNNEVKLPSQVERIIPTKDALIRPQDEIGVDLANDYTGVLELDRAEIPEAQLNRVDPLGQLFFRPGPGKELGRFSPGVHTVTVIYWPKAETRASAQSFTWTFRVG